jgi:hypothetical protein
MKTVKRQKNIVKSRFATCMKRVWLLSISPRAARRAPASKSVSTVPSSAGVFSWKIHGRLPKQMNLTRCEIFRGKVPRAKLKTKNSPRKPVAIAPSNL